MIGNQLSWLIEFDLILRVFINFVIQTDILHQKSKNKHSFSGYTKKTLASTSTNSTTWTNVDTILVF